jgi:hypothetical protein
MEPQRGPKSVEKECGKKTGVDPDVAALGPTQNSKRLSERRDVILLHGIVFVAQLEHADAPHAVALLRSRYHRPRRRAPEPRDERPALH